MALVSYIFSIIFVIVIILFYSYYLDGAKNERIFLMTVLITLWGSRLTFNFARRGGYGNLIHHEEGTPLDSLAFT